MLEADKGQGHLGLGNGYDTPERKSNWTTAV